ncbi:hypothetical protein [Maritimibacter sp. DP1N21-5]|uniref:hypothetical protein n=1 Tax=Maritimibacter sp. DP1N21-5 TaxID=2836867 RepID=UPI001C47CBB1|nr:hypothetical protein [Maritimibacter sp. DP1N21-5]MBV7408112.1 hypothetical protein [Maritimibacter sp. DP1N21-5]
MRPILALAALPLVLAACETGTMTATQPGATTPGGLPENVLSLAAPYQDVNSARLDEVTGCYSYLHRGPVESTYLPLRTIDGRPICARAPEDIAVAN